MSNQPAYILQTDRLQLRQFNVDDCEFIIRLLNSEGWIKYIGDRNVKTKEQAQNYLENGPLKSYEQNGFGLSMVETKDGIANWNVRPNQTRLSGTSRYWLCLSTRVFLHGLWI